MLWGGGKVRQRGNAYGYNARDESAQIHCGSVGKMGKKMWQFGEQQKIENYARTSLIVILEANAAD